MEKKSEIESRIFLYVLVVVIILLLLVSLVIFLKNLKENQRRALLEKTRKDLQETVDSLDFGSREEKCINIPSPTTELCFFDLSKRDEILQSPIINRYQIIKNNIVSGVAKNFFVLSGDKVESFYIGDVCLDHYPYFTCFEAKTNRLCISFEGKGRCALLIQDWKYCINPDAEGKIDASDKVTNEFIVGPSSAWMLFKVGQQLTYPPDTGKEICVEPVLFPADALISEVYNLTPIATGISAPGASLTMKYYSELLPSQDTDKLKIKQYDTATREWKVIKTANNKLDTGEKTVSDNIPILSYVGVFGPEPPKPVIKLRYDSDGTELPKSDNGVYIALTSTQIRFDGTETTDSDNDIDNYEWDLGDGRTSSGSLFADSYGMQGSYIVELKVKDKKGNIGTAKVELHIIDDNGNRKDPDKYSDGLIFLVNSNINNNNEVGNILMLIPLAMWDGYLGNDLGIYDYPLLDYLPNTAQKEDYNLDGLKSKYEESGSFSIRHFGTIPTELQGEAVMTEESFNDYFDYWLVYNDMVIVNPANIQTAGLMSALYASFLNAPLYFVDQIVDSHDPRCARITGKKVYLIGSLDNLINQCSPASIITTITLNDLRNNPQLNPYGRLHDKFYPADKLS